MFTEFQNQVWTNSATGVAVTNNTDWSIDGSSKKIVFSETGRTVTLSYNSVTLSEYEEISLYVYIRDTLYTDLFSITVGGAVFTFNRNEFERNRWNHVLIDCSSMGASTSLVITSLVPDLTLFVDYLGYRRVTYNADMDVINALKAHINLDYGVTTTLSAAALAGAERIDLTPSGYINDTSALELTNSLGTIETVYLMNKNGQLMEPLTNAFALGDSAKIICPVRSEDYEDLQPDPICGIKVYDLSVDRQPTIVGTKNKCKIKEYLGTLGIVIYIDCRSQKKLLQMAREFNRKYGKEFTFLLDGERVEIFMENSAFAEDMIGNNPRMAYYYKFEPQPYLYMNSPRMETITVTSDSMGAGDLTSIIEPETDVIG